MWNLLRRLGCHFRTWDKGAPSHFPTHPTCVISQEGRNSQWWRQVTSNSHFHLLPQVVGEQRCQFPPQTARVGDRGCAESAPLRHFQTTVSPSQHAAWTARPSHTARVVQSLECLWNLASINKQVWGFSGSSPQPGESHSCKSPYMEVYIDLKWICN